MSLLEHCYHLKKNCASDRRCQLEYNADRENPTCVPTMANMFSTTLENRPEITRDDLQLFNTILDRLLPGNDTNGGPTADALKQALVNLIDALRPNVEHKVRGLLSEGDFASWNDAALKISQEIIDEVHDGVPGLIRSLRHERATRLSNMYSQRLREAERIAREIREIARRRADGIRARAAREAEHIRLRARRRADEIIARAGREQDRDRMIYKIVIVTVILLFVDALVDMFMYVS